MAYNEIMLVNTKKPKIVYVLRILLPIACLGVLFFIFYNSLKTSEESSAQSSTVTAVAQEIIRAVAPESKWATATGEDYEIFHALVRDWAHLSEFALLGALLCWCYFAYTFSARYFYLPVSGIVAVPIFDEWLQTFSMGRASALSDVMTDTLGGAMGLAFALITVLIGATVYALKKKKRGRISENGK